MSATCPQPFAFGALSGRWDSNPRPSPWQGGVLPTELRPLMSAEGRNRTGDTRIFSPLLYQLSYLGALYQRPQILHTSGGIVKVVKVKIYWRANNLACCRQVRCTCGVRCKCRSLRLHGGLPALPVLLSQVRPGFPPQCLPLRNLRGGVSLAFRRGCSI